MGVRGGPLEIPVKLKVHDSLFVPLAKWPMLMAGNYRCIRRDGMISIQGAVHGNLDQSRQIYDWVWKLCKTLGADDADMVPFEKYAKAVEGLTNPSSAARATRSRPPLRAASAALAASGGATSSCWWCCRPCARSWRSAASS